MKKIISDEIERLNAKHQMGQLTEATTFTLNAVLSRLLVTHPALDYADELLGGYSRITNHYHSLGCGDEECMPLCKEAQALLKKIEEKK